jgi:hypothetical protein
MLPAIGLLPSLLLAADESTHLPDTFGHAESEFSAAV